MVKLLKLFVAQGQWKSKKQRSSGKNFLESDFRAEHLRVIYDLYDDKIVKEYLTGNLKPKDPVLFSQFD